MSPDAVVWVRELELMRGAADMIKDRLLRPAKVGVVLGEES